MNFNIFSSQFRPIPHLQTSGCDKKSDHVQIQDLLVINQLINIYNVMVEAKAIRWISYYKKHLANVRYGPIPNIRPGKGK